MPPTKRFHTKIRWGDVQSSRRTYTCSKLTKRKSAEDNCQVKLVKETHGKNRWASRVILTSFPLVCYWDNIVRALYVRPRYANGNLSRALPIPVRTHFANNGIIPQVRNIALCTLTILNCVLLLSLKIYSCFVIIIVCSPYNVRCRMTFPINHWNF